MTELRVLLITAMYFLPDSMEQSLPLKLYIHEFTKYYQVMYYKEYHRNLN
jgi:hypothetical protein